MPFSAGSLLTPPYIADQVLHRQQIAQWMLRKTPQWVSFTDFGGKSGDLTANIAINDGALAAARAYLSNSPYPPRLIFPPGIYPYSVSPNWALKNAVIDAWGEVHLRYYGTGNAVTIDAGASPGKIGNCYFGCEGIFLVEAPSTAQNGIFVRGMYRGGLRTKCYGAGNNSAGLYLAGNVLMRIEHSTTNDDTGGFYLSANPLTGISVTHGGNAAFQNSYCTFINTNVQGCQIGIYLDGTLGNLFIGGDSESNTIYGLQLTANALNNRFIGTDFEANTINDIFVSGNFNEFNSIDSTSVVVGTGATANMFLGGNYDALTINAGAISNAVQLIKYSRGLGVPTFTDNGTGTRINSIYNISTNLWSH